MVLHPGEFLVTLASFQERQVDTWHDYSVEDVKDEKDVKVMTNWHVKYFNFVNICAVIGRPVQVSENSFAETWSKTQDLRHPDVRLQVSRTRQQ